MKGGKYDELAQSIGEGGMWTPVVLLLTVEIGGRGYVSKDTIQVWDYQRKMEKG